MNTVAVVGDKGGSGKTTFVVNLAALASAVAPTLVIDTDPQASIEVWSNLRPAELMRPKCLASTAHKLPQHVADARRAQFEWTLIDTAPGEPPAARVAVQAADLVLIPIKPDLFSFEAIIKTVAMVRSYRKMYGIFINSAPAKREGREAPLVRTIRHKLHEEENLAHFGKFLWNAQITGRNIVPTALNQGLGIVEVASDELAGQEFRSLWLAVAHLLEVGKKR
jgi:chromosome partitioning protein